VGSDFNFAAIDVDRGRARLYIRTNCCEEVSYQQIGSESLSGIFDLNKKDVSLGSRPYLKGDCL
jgi:hypothetical protein